MKQFNQPILLFLIILIIAQAIPFSHCCHDEERNALLTFKSNLIDPSNRLSSWQVGKNCCNWEGIQCSKESLHVVSVDLQSPDRHRFLNAFINKNYNSYSTALTGAISPSLFNLSHLRYLDLSYNNFNFPKIPYQFVNLSHLTHLDLRYNILSGAIPPSLFNLNHLRYLDLSHNYFHCSKIPYQFANLKHLTHLDLSNSMFSGSITTQFANLSSLRYLDVSCFDFRDYVSSTDTSWVRGLANLEELRLMGVDLNSAIPIQLANLTSLSFLDLENCQLQAVSLPYLPPQLKEISVSYNPDLGIDLSLISNASLLNRLDANNSAIQGSLSSITNLSRLEYLFLNNNNITGQIPSSLLSNLKNLKNLDLYGNNLQGPIPESTIYEMSSLKSLDFGKNSIEGTVSLISLINKLNLSHIDLSSNRITVEINDQHPPLPSKLQQLDTLRLDSCNIKGYIPGYFCNLTNIFFLTLSLNNITGTIPSCLSKFEKLMILDFSSNNLQGTIPHSLLFTNMSSLIILDLSSNNLRGHLPLPPKISIVFDLSKNNFTGGISTEFGEKLIFIEYLSLSDNKLSGSIPSSLCSNEYSGLQYLDLSMNQLRGTIPSNIHNCSSLISLNLGYNNLSGSIPIFFGSLHNLKILYLRSNKLNGLIPKEITHLHELQILDLSINNLSDPIPVEIGYLEMLKSRPNDRSLIPGKTAFMADMGVPLQMVIKGTMTLVERLYNYNSGIDLSCNNLEGNIPEDIGLLKGLAMLNLSHNCLSGRIPTRVGNMVGLESLDLSFNKLSGDIPESLASIDFLGSLNLSYNNLSGRIPKGHLETLSGDNGSTYFGNYWLCGLPTNRSCPVEGSLQEDVHVGEDNEDEDASEKWLLFDIVFLDFGVGFWGLFLVLLIKKEKWWFGYWRAVDNIAAKIIDCIR